MEGTQHGSARGEVLAQISTGLVQLHSRFYGKGPTKAKTHLVNDTVISILRGGFTTVERTLIDQGNVDPVYEMRRSFQKVMEEQFTAVVEEATGRKVIAYMSQIHQSPDLAVEIFVLEPLGDPVAVDGAEALPGSPLRSLRACDQRGRGDGNQAHRRRDGRASGRRAPDHARGDNRRER